LLLVIGFISCNKNDSAPVLTDQTFYEKLMPSALIGFWKFSGNANDVSGHGNNGALTQGHEYFGAGLPVLTDDRFGHAQMAYHFDHGGNIEVPYSLELNPSQMTISLWCRKSTVGRTINLDTYTMTSLNRWNGYKFQLQGSNLTFYTVKAVEPSGDTVYYDRDNAGLALSNNAWYHVAVTFKSGEEDFYVNGVLVKKWTNVPGTPITLASPINFVIGQDLPTDKYLAVDGDYQVA
jgi:hypothetical protein